MNEGQRLVMTRTTGRRSGIAAERREGVEAIGGGWWVGLLETPRETLMERRRRRI